MYNEMVNTLNLRLTIDAGAAAMNRAVDPKRDLINADAGTRAQVLLQAVNHGAFSASNLVIFESYASSRQILL